MVVVEALARLPVRQRRAVVLRHFDDLSVVTVAEIMGSSTEGGQEPDRQGAGAAA